MKQSEMWLKISITISAIAFRNAGVVKLCPISTARLLYCRAECCNRHHLCKIVVLLAVLGATLKVFSINKSFDALFDNSWLRLEKRKL